MKNLLSLSLFASAIFGMYTLGVLTGGVLTGGVLTGGVLTGGVANDVLTDKEGNTSAVSATGNAGISDSRASLIWIEIA